MPHLTYNPCNSQRKKYHRQSTLLPFPLQPLIIPLQTNLHSHTATDTDDTKTQHQQHRHRIPRPIASREEVRTPDITKLAEQVDHRGGTGSLLGRLIQRRGRPGIYHRVGGEAARCVQEGGEVSGRNGKCADGDDEADHCHCHGDGDVEASFLMSVRGVSDKEGDCCADEVWWCGAQQGDCRRAEMEAFDDRGEEVIEALEKIGVNDGLLVPVGGSTYHTRCDLHTA